MIQVHPFIIFIASIFTSNMIFSNFLGMCSFIAVSREIPTANSIKPSTYSFSPSSSSILASANFSYPYFISFSAFSISS
jgi:Na+-transporting NADH:ubiquinone oxidoreductase subunit NqrE